MNLAGLRTQTGQTVPETHTPRITRFEQDLLQMLAVHSVIWRAEFSAVCSIVSHGMRPKPPCIIPPPEYKLAGLARNSSQLRPQTEADQESGCIGRQRDGGPGFRQFLGLLEDDGLYSAGTQGDLECQPTDACADNTDPIRARPEIRVYLLVFEVLHCSVTVRRVMVCRRHHGPPPHVRAVEPQFQVPVGQGLRRNAAIFVVERSRMGRLLPHLAEQQRWRHR